MLKKDGNSVNENREEQCSGTYYTDSDNKNRKRKLCMLRQPGGSITVEASLILPLVILITFALIYLSFYLHDICRIRGVVDGTLHQAGLAYKHEASLETGTILYEEINERGVFYALTGNTDQEEKAMRYHILNELSGGLFLARVKEVNTEVGMRSLSADVKVKIMVKLPVLGGLFQTYSETIISGRSKLHNPAETVRACEVVLHTGTKIKGVEQLQERFQTLLSK